MWHRTREAARRAAPALLFFAAVRLTGLAVVTAWALRDGRRPSVVLGLGWDAHWYWRIAEYGYGTVIPSAVYRGLTYDDLAFFPLYPTLIRVVATVTPVGPVSAALLLAWGSAALAAWGFYAVGERLHGRRTAVALVALWGLLPHSVVLTVAYTEPLMTACAAWALYATLTRRWLTAAALAALAGLARPNGLAAAAAVCVAALTAGRQGPRPWLAAALAPLGWLGYVGWVGVQTGEPLGYFRVQRGWGSTFDFGQGTARFAGQLITGELVTGEDRLPYVIALAVLVAALVLLVLSLLGRQPLPLLVYSGVLAVIALGGASYFQCMPRFLLPAFPLLVPAALALARARLRTAVVAVVALARLSLWYGTYLVTVAPTAF